MGGAKPGKVKAPNTIAAPAGAQVQKPARREATADSEVVVLEGDGPEVVPDKKPHRAPDWTVTTGMSDARKAELYKK